MNFKNKSPFTNARKRAAELCAKAMELNMPVMSSPSEVMEFGSKLMPIKKDLEKVHTSCKEYHESWMDCNAALKAANDSRAVVEEEALNQLYNETDGIKELYEKIKNAYAHIDAMIQQSFNTGQSFFAQASTANGIIPSAPIDDTTSSDQQVAQSDQNSPVSTVHASIIPASTMPITTASAFSNPAFTAASSTTVTSAIVNQQPGAVKQVSFAPMLQTNAAQQNPDPFALFNQPSLPPLSILQATSQNTTLNPQPTPFSVNVPASGQNPVYPALSQTPLQPTNQLPFPASIFPPPQTNQPNQFYNTPKMNLPYFYGNPRDFRHWASSFSFIHHNPNMSQIEKMMLLMSLLKGKAKEAVRFYDVNYLNYDLVLRTLYDRFGRPEKVLDALFNEFANIHVKSNRINDIAQAVYDMESILEQIKANGFNVEDATLMILYKQKVPPRILQQANLYGLNPTFSQLRERVMTVVNSEIDLPNIQRQNYFHANSQNQNDRQHFPRQIATQQHRKNFEPRPDDKNRSKNKHCIFCSKQHNPSSCQAVTDTRERRKIAAEKKLCFKCLDSHLMNSCKDSKPCIHCKEHHHDSLCFKNPSLKSKQPVHVVKLQQKKEVSMMVITAPVHASAEKPKSCDANLFLDCGAGCSFIHADLARRLKLPVIEEEMLDLQRFGDDGQVTSLKVACKKVSLVVKAQNNSDIPINAYTIKHLTNVLPTIDPETRNKKWVKPDILIGNDFFWEFFTTEKSEDGYKVIDSLLGKMVCGTGVPVNSILLNHPQAPPTTNEIVEKFFQIDQAGTDESPYTEEEDKAVEKFVQDTEIVNGRMQCRLPFIVPDPPLESNRFLSLKCLESQLKKVSKKPELLFEIDKIMKQQLQDEMLEIAPKSSPTAKKVYLPHHAIETPHKSTKVRIVFNSSAKTSKDSKSLNDWLYAGPSMIPEIPGLLLRIRTEEILVSADVEKAFLQLSLHPDDRDFTRFFWIKDVNDYIKNGFKTENIIELRFTRIFFGSKSSPFSLNAAIRKLLLNLDDAEFATQLKKNIYVDNVFIGDSNVENVIRKTETAVDLFKTIKMNLRDIMSNNSEVNNHFNVEPSLLSVLGLQWNPVDDDLTIKMPSKTLDKPTITKRDVLAEIGSKYDPLGILTPVMVRLKLFMQDLWKKKTGWNEPLTPEEAIRWKSLIEEPMAVSIKRFLKRPEGEYTVELHIFCDASAKAYAAVAFIVFRSKSGEYKIYLILSKSKLCPIKSVTIPRLELLALALGVKVLCYIKANVDLKWDKTVLWTDSSPVFYWLRSNKPLKRFVDNRVKIIKASDADIRHVPTKENPADIASRGASISTLKNCNLWWNGPAFLKNDEKKWPTLKSSYVQEICPEVEKEFIFAVHPVIDEKKEKLISAKHGSSWNRLVRVTAYCLYFIQKCRKQESPDPRSTEAFKRAEKVLIKDIQQANPPNKSTCRELRIFKDGDEMLRVRSRLENSGNDDLASPLFLPQSEETNLLILKIHHGSLHAGPRHVLTEIRQNFWLSKGLSTVKKAIKSCRPCLKYKAKPYQLPEMAALPNSRVKQYLPFQHVGVDCAGPFTIKNNGEDQKVWITLFTCLTTRAVYLDFVKEMSASAFINVFRRFINTFGTPSSILSDNGKNFKATGTHIAPIWHNSNPDPELMDYVAGKKIDWHFITERAPWKGGVYERLIGSVKIALKYGIGRKRLSEEDFRTLLVEVQGILNSRPLVEAEGELKAIRPIDFILPNASLGTSRFNDQSDESTDPTYFPQEDFKTKLLKTLKTTTTCIDRTWKRWNKEYLTKLRETSQNLHKQKGLDLIPEVGEVVLIDDDEVPRGSWRLGKVVQVNESRDGKVRAVVVQTSNGNLLNRSPAHLYPLEANLEPECRKPKTTSNSDLSNTPDTPPRETAQQVKTTPENRRITRSMKSTVNSLFFFLTIFQLFLLSVASPPVIYDSYCKNGEIVSKTSNVTKISIHLPHRSKLIHVTDTITIIPIPGEILNSYSVFETTFWSNTGDSTTINLECEFIDFCDLVTCVFCQDHITHPHCWAWSTWFCIFLIFSLVGILISRKCHQTHSPLLVKGGRWMLRSLSKNPSDPDNAQMEEGDTASRKRHMVRVSPKRLDNVENAKMEEGDAESQRTADTVSVKALFKMPSIRFVQRKALMFSIIMLLFGSVNACSDSFVIEAKSESCLMTSENHIACNFSTKSWITVGPGKDACLLLQSDEKIPVGSIKISAKAFATCSKLHYASTKFINIKVKSAKRCPGMGSCTNNNCAEVWSQSRIDELGNANDYPGVTECVESCGSITCGCALFGTGCTFYRYYAEIENDEQLKTFSCPEWEPWYNITVTFESHNVTHARVFTLQPGQTLLFEDIKISIRKASLEFLREFPTDVMFLEKDNEIAWLNKEAAGETRLFTCANGFGCKLRHGACNCRAADSTVQCACDDQEEMKEQWLKNKLPNRIGEHLFLPNSKHGPIAQVAADLDLVIETYNLSASSLIHYTDCSIDNISVSGTNGPEGALVKTFCKTKFGSSIGHVYCNSRMFDVKCTKNGVWTERRWYTNDVNIDEECLLVCQISQHHFKIKGHLHQKKHADDWNVIHGIGEDNTSGIKSFGIGFLSTMQHLYDYLLFIIIGVAAILVAIVLLK
uniref:Integrase catalytic domain-containing protein n=1 Tax=Panagrolaimus sp. PS1159 TaxID=55785 RepID=A0AC35ET50_9BILA